MSKLKQRLKVTAILNVFAIGAMYGFNQMISSAAILKNILKPNSGKYYRWKYGDLFYKKSGKGAPILLIHDLNPYSSGFEWHLIEEKLAKDHTVYTLDILGCGRSEKPGITYTNYLYVQLITDFINEVIGEKTDVASTGLSSSFVVMASYNNPDIINKITMINPVSLKKLTMAPNDKSKCIKTIMSIPIIGTTIYNLKSCHQNIEYVLTENYFYNPFRIHQKYVDAYYESAHFRFSSGRFLLSCIEGFYLNIDIKKALQNINNEIIIIYGDKLSNEKEIVDNYSKLAKNCCIYSARDTKLLPQLETPEVILALMNKNTF